MASDWENRLRAMRWQHPEYIPVTVSILAAAWMKYREEMDEIVRRHPIIFGEQTGKRDYDDVRGTYSEGRHVDEWGCVWHNVHAGCEAIDREHPVPTRADVHKLKAPTQDTGFRHGFMYLRLCDLRGFEEMMVDFAEEPEELQMLLDIVCGYNVRQAEILFSTLDKGCELVAFGDDLGMQHALPISPAKWRKYLKPCYEKIYRPFREAGMGVFMHTDGHIVEIIPDLIDVGVTVVNPQIRANGLDNLVEVCKGKVCLSLDLDRQLFPFCSPADIDDHVREAVEKLGSPEGGLWLIAEIGDDVPLETVEAICTALEKYRGYY
jgi:hypothetical protein